MCSTSTAMLVLAFTLTTSAQHLGGGMAGGRVPGPPNQSGAFPPRVGRPFGGNWNGARPSWQPGLHRTPCPFLSQGCNSAPPFWRAGIFRAPYPRVVVWNGWPALGGYGFNNAPDPGYPVEPYWPDDYAQPFNVPVVPSVPIQAPSAMGAEMAPEQVERSAADNTAVKYWVTGKTFHFITTQGDHMQVPTALVDRVYPTPNQSHGAESKREPKN
jgi:hypothetical protein